MENLTSIIESLLFVRCEPMSISELADITGQAEEVVVTALQTLEEEYAFRGFCLVHIGEQVQLGSNPASALFVKNMMKHEFTEEVSRSAMETLAVVAYKGPVSRPQIEFIRGVNSSFTLRNLLMRGLVERVENPKDARSYLYQVSADFLKHLGLTKMESLPQFEEFQKKTVEILSSSANIPDREE